MRPQGAKTNRSRRIPIEANETDDATWSSTFKRPFTDEMNHFLNEAAKELDKQ